MQIIFIVALICFSVKPFVSSYRSMIRTPSGLILPKQPLRTLSIPKMADPDVPPEVDPTRRDPDEPAPEIPVRLPMVDFGGTKMDVNSRLLKDRIIMIGKQVDDNMANLVVAQLLYLYKEDPSADITMYINSPGGSISSGMAIFDTMQFISCDINTVCFGMAASMGAFLLGAGTKGIHILIHTLLYTYTSLIPLLIHTLLYILYIQVKDAHSQTHVL